MAKLGGTVKNSRDKNVSFSHLQHQTGMGKIALGKRTPQQWGMWISTADLPRSHSHVFYRKLNELLSEVNFDHEVESLCKPNYAEPRGRTAIPPSVYLPMFLIVFSEGTGSQ